MLTTWLLANDISVGLLYGLASDERHRQNVCCVGLTLGPPLYVLGTTTNIVRGSDCLLRHSSLSILLKSVELSVAGA